MPAPSETPFTSFIEALRVAPTAPGSTSNRFQLLSLIMFTFVDAKGAADRLAREVVKVGPQSLEYVLQTFWCAGSLTTRTGILTS